MLHAASPHDWDILLGSASRFRAGTGVTSPIMYALPEWSRNNAIDLDVVSQNPAFLSNVNDDMPKFYPLVAQGFVIGEHFSLTGAFKAPTDRGEEILADVLLDDLQRVQASFHLMYVMQNFSYSLHFTQTRNVWLENSQADFFYQFFRDFRLQFSSGGQIFDTPDWGRLEFGSGIKGVFRSGAEKLRSVSAFNSSTNFTDGQFLEQGFAIGLDYSLLWSSPDYYNSPWGYQFAVVGKDVGTTRFFKAEALYELLGVSIPFTREMPSYPNDTIVGFALKLPNFRDGIRSALRVEYGYWNRPIGTVDKLGVSYEVRFPKLASLYAGLRGNQWTGGLSLRFRGLEFDIGSFVDLWGSNTELKKRRSWVMELKGAF